MHIIKTSIAILAAATMGAGATMGAATAAVPDAERAGVGVRAIEAIPGIQLADNCGNWAPSQRNAGSNCLVPAWEPDLEWIKRGDPGSQDDSNPNGRDAGYGQEDDDPEPCFC